MTFKLRELLSVRRYNYWSHTSWSPLFCRSKHLWDCVILGGIYVGEVKNTLEATYLFTAHCAVLLLGIIAHPLPAEAPQVGRYAFIGYLRQRLVHGRWLQANGAAFMRSGVEGGGGGMLCLPLNRRGGCYQTRTWWQITISSQKWGTALSTPPKQWPWAPNKKLRCRYQCLDDLTLISDPWEGSQ